MKKAINQSTMVLATTIISIALVIATIISFFNVMTLNAQVDQSNLDRFELTFNANRFMDGSAYLTNEVRAFAVTGDIEHYNNYWYEINTAQNRDIGVDKMKEIGITPEEQDKIDHMYDLSNNLVPLESEAMDMTKEGRREDAIEAVYGESYYKWVGEILSTKEEFLSMLDTRAKTRVDDLIAQTKQAEIVTLALVIGAVLLQIISGLTTMTKTISPIKKMQNEMEKIARGDLSSNFALTPDTSEIGRLTGAIIQTKSELKAYISDIRDKLHHMSKGDLALNIDIDYIGDFAPIKTALTEIIDSLNETLSKVSASSLQVSTGARQMADSAQLLADGSSQQASSVEQLSTYITEIASKTSTNAEMAGKASELANEILSNAEKGSRQMDEMISAVEDINRASQSINKVIKVIDDIAFQTNILALNAAVEAARAGQHGKGFAVVAEEVRNLAGKSAEAAKETGSLIADSTQKAELGSRIAKDTAASFSDIMSGISESARIVGDIAKSSEEQTVGIEHINDGINQVSQVIAQNSATAQQEAASSEEMSGQSEMLNDLMSHFNMRESGASAW